MSEAAFDVFVMPTPAPYDASSLTLMLREVEQHWQWAYILTDQMGRVFSSPLSRARQSPSREVALEQAIREAATLATPSVLDWLKTLLPGSAIFAQPEVGRSNQPTVSPYV